MLDEERRRAEQLGKAWGLDRDSLPLTVDICAVLQHNDPGSWNVVVDGQDFTLLDWEDAVQHGFPLVDLWYFLADAIAHLDGVEPAGRAGHFTQLFRGELASSGLLFAWTRRAVAELHIPVAAVGPLATFCWLRHGSADRDRRQASAGMTGSRQAPVDFSAFAERWLTEPGLGPRWDRWAQPAT